VVEYLYWKNYSEGRDDGVVHLKDVGYILRDTAVYCSAEKYGLENLKRLALRKQGEWSGVAWKTVFASARYAYDHTPDSDTKLRRCYISLIMGYLDNLKVNRLIQAEMMTGSKLALGLFEAMYDKIIELSSAV
jgi:hypothetical protein